MVVRSCRGRCALCHARDAIPALLNFQFAISATMRGVPMLNLLAPYALWGLALLSIPVAVHIFRPRKVRQTPFSSLRWLHRTQQRLSRRIKWHQVFLFLLRAALAGRRRGNSCCG